MTPELDGATVHCVGVSVMCFKIGRITIPPAIAMACEGFTRRPTPSDDGAPVAGYSATNPPPSWTKHAQKLRSQKFTKEYQ
jgi:hypothetical protein